MDVYFCQGEIQEPFYDRPFSTNPMLKTHSNKVHDNTKLHPPNPESIEKLVELIIHSIPA